MAFIAHYLNTPITNLYEMQLDELHFWYEEAVTLHKHLNPPPKNG